MDPKPFDEAEHGSTEPPPPELMYAPARNEGDFADLPPGWERAAAESLKHAHERSAKAAPPRGQPPNCS